MRGDGALHVTGLSAPAPNVHREVCAVCGKGFSRSPEHVYKIHCNVGRSYHERYLCSYTCWRKAQRAQEEAREARSEQRREKRRAKRGVAQALDEERRRLE